MLPSPTLTWRAPSDPPKATTNVRSSPSPSSRRARDLPVADRSTPAISGRTGVPVTTARGSGFPGQPTALARAHRPNSRLADRGRRPR